MGVRFHSFVCPYGARVGGCGKMFISVGRFEILFSRRDDDLGKLGIEDEFRI